MPGKPQPLHISPDGQILYAGMREENGVAALAIDARNGRLTLLGHVAVPGPATYVSCDQARRVLFSASWGGNSLSCCLLDAQGVPQPVNQVENGLPHAHAALMDASSRWLLVPMLGADAIRIYRLEEDSRVALRATQSCRPGSGPRHLVFSPDNFHVHCLNELDGSIDLFDFDAGSGQLTLQQTVSMLPPGFEGKPWAAELRLSPDGRFLYATDRTSSVIAAFAIDPQSGQMKLTGHFPTETRPRGMGIDASGRWLIAAGQLSDHLTVYALDPVSGGLAARHRQPTGQDPICVEIITFE